MFDPPNDAGLQPAAWSEQGISDSSEMSETMPVELEPVHQRLLTMRAAWENSLPAADRLASYARALPAQSAVFESAEIITDLAQDEARGASHMKQRNKQATGVMNSKDIIDTSADTNRSSTSSNRRHLTTPLRTLMAVAAAVLVVGLLAATFALFAHRSPSTVGVKATQTASAKATQTAMPTSTPQPAQSWTTVESLTSINSFSMAAPAIAPSDPRIVYEVTSSPQLALRRSSDGGQTWQSFPLPAVSNVQYEMQVYVSPLNPDVLVLHTDGSTPQSPSCATQADAWSISRSGASIQPLADLSPDAPTSGHAICTQFLSTNGGKSWMQTSDYFENTALFSPVDFGLFMVQGNRLYVYVAHSCPSSATATCSPSIGLLVSLDGGISWNPAPLPNSGEAFCGVGMAPTGTVMFAITAPFVGNCEAGSPSVVTNTIWRSDDAGAHWAQVSQLQFSGVNSLSVVPNSGAAFPTVYLSTNTAGTPTITANGGTVPTTISFQMSKDGGKTWTNVPTAGVPAGWASDGVIAQTSDGKIIAVFGPANNGGPGTTLYSLRPGDSSWHKLAPTPPQQSLYYLVTSNQGSDTLWAISMALNGSQTTPTTAATYTVYRLQL